MYKELVWYTFILDYRARKKYHQKFKFVKRFNTFLNNFRSILVVLVQCSSPIKILAEPVCVPNKKESWILSLSKIRNSGSKIKIRICIYKTFLVLQGKQFLELVKKRIKNGGKIGRTTLSKHNAVLFSNYLRPVVWMIWSKRIFPVVFDWMVNSVVVQTSQRTRSAIAVEWITDKQGQPVHKTEVIRLTEKCIENHTNNCKYRKTGKW